VLDLTMPGMDGLTALPGIREAAPDSAVVVLTATEDDTNLLTAIRLGAARYLLKNEPPERIVTSFAASRTARRRSRARSRDA
jgi:DNA-binding NarL/FixJ family response regulator